MRVGFKAGAVVDDLLDATGSEPRYWHLKKQLDV